MEIPVYIRCRNCGRYMEEPAAVLHYYCSEECSVQFTRCGNCGSYFPKKESDTGEYCSNECMVRYGDEEITMQRE